MRGRFFIGAAVVLGAVSVTSEAHALKECDDIINEAAASSDRQVLNNLRLDATQAGCLPAVIQGIDYRISMVSGVTVSKPGETPVGNPPPTTATLTSAPLRTPAPAAAQTPQVRSLTIGQTANGVLTPATPVDDGIPYELWSFRAPAAQSLHVSMTASQGSPLDTYLVVGRMRDDAFEEIASNDDRGDGSLNSMLCFTPDGPSDYVIRARSFSAQQFGGYELLVQPTPTASRALAEPRPLTVGESLFGSLTCDSPVDAEGGGYSYDLWSFDANAGQVLQLSMVSGDLDSYLTVGRVSDGRFVEMASDDDGGEGLNSLLRFTPTEAGEYAIRARTFGAGQHGSYQLLVQPMAPVAARVPVSQTANSWVLAGEIASEGAMRYADFEFQGARGQRYAVRAVSTEFTPIVDVGSLQEDGNLTPVDFFGTTDRASNVAEFSAERGTRYIVRVSAPVNGSGHFDLLVTQAR